MARARKKSRSSPKRLSHVDARGRARMVDVSAKAVTSRRATATAVVTMQPGTLKAIVAGSMAKGEVLATARLAAIQAAKRTDELIPLCHPLAIDTIEIDFAVRRPKRVQITATVSVSARTGVEMEALTAVSVAALTIYDMCKAVDRGMTIGPVRLIEKSGGRSGHWRR